MNENIKIFLEENECECVMVKHGTARIAINLEIMITFF